MGYRVGMDTLPQIRNFKLLDIPDNGDELKVWPLLLCAVLFASGTWIILLILDGRLNGWRALAVFGAHQLCIYALAWVMYRVQKYGLFWWNVQKTRRGFRVVLKDKR